MRKLTNITAALALVAFLAMPNVAMAAHVDSATYGDKVVWNVKQALDSDPELKKYDLDVVMLRNGTIRLSGDVLWRADKEKAAHTALMINGVHKVSNTIGISGVTSEFVMGG